MHFSLLGSQDDERSAIRICITKSSNLRYSIDVYIRVVNTIYCTFGTRTNVKDIKVTMHFVHTRKRQYATVVQAMRTTLDKTISSLCFQEHCGYRQRKRLV